ncbi:hypothetical protein ACH4CC_35715 [Streptomyces lydicus]|uniref:hypothetical protein n=1 Tax=Streptomyces lydicus TaxID=47763 RepID=UPI003797DC0A
MTNIVPGVLLPVPVYRYRKHPGQMTKQTTYSQLESASREHAWNYGRSLRAAFRSGEALGAAVPRAFPRDHEHRSSISA